MPSAVGPWRAGRVTSDAEMHLAKSTGAMPEVAHE
jgi:hypothetical protein